MIEAWLKLEADLKAMIREVKLEPQRRHERFLKDLETRSQIITQQVIHEIQVKFREAFPNRWYAFLVRRPRDIEGGIPAWPLMFRDRERAEKYEDRVSPVVEVRL